MSSTRHLKKNVFFIQKFYDNNTFTVYNNICIYLICS